MAESCDRIVRALRAGGVEVDIGHFVRRLGAQGRFEEQHRGRYWAWPIEDDPAHALNLAWTAVKDGADAGAASPTGSATPMGFTHVVAFGGYLPLLAGPVFAAWLGVPLVTLIRGNDFDANLFTPRRRDVLADALERSALVCAVAQDKVDRIAALHPGRRVVRVPNGIELERFTPLPSDLERAAAWRAASVPAGRRVLGLFGQLKRKKGGAFFLDALRRSGRAGDVHVLLSGWLDPDMEAWLGEHGEGISFSVLPFADRYDLIHRYLACDVVVLPSFYDGMPNVMVEAAALGVPLMASRCGGMADWLEDDHTALMFEPGDPGGCGWAIERAVAWPEERLRELGAAACKLAERELDQRLEAARYAELLRETQPASEPIPQNGSASGPGAQPPATPASEPTPLRRAAP
jgi:glycosyltransferase involved in cell wall biosynthesis